MDYLMILLSILIFTIQTICFKQFNHLFMKNIKSYFIFNTLYFSIVAGILSLSGTDFSSLSTITIITSLVFGILFIVTMLLYMSAMGNGPLSYTSLLFSFGLLVPVIVSTVLWDEKIGLLHIAGLALLFVTFYLGSSVNKTSKKSINVKWLLLSVAALLGNGAIMTVSKAHQMAIPGREINEFLVIAFGSASIISFLLFLLKNGKREGDLSHLKNSLFFILVILAGITTAYGNRIGLYLSGRITAVVQFPAVNGGVVILSSIASVMILKEKISTKALAGLIPGLLALVLLSR